MDVITLSSDEEEEDPLRTDGVSSSRKHKPSRTNRPTGTPEIIIFDTPPKEKSNRTKRIKLISVVGNEANKMPNTDSSGQTDIKTEETLNGFDMTQPPKKTILASPTPSTSTTTKEDTRNLGHSMETNQSESLFRKFTDLCREVGDPGPEMDKIISRAWHCYSRAKIEFITSREYIRLVEKNIASVRKDPDGMYSYMLEVCTELKSRKVKDKVISEEPEAKKAKISFSTSEVASTSQEKRESHESSDKVDDDNNSNPVSEEEQRRKIHLKKLSKRLKGITKQIHKLETAEVDWDDDGDSTYIALQTWKDRAVKIYKKMCELSGEVDKSKYRIQLHNLASASRFPDVDRCIRKFINSTGQFPDFQDILKIYKEYNENHHLGLAPIQVHNSAADMFQLIGNELQRKRKLDDWDLHCDFLRDEPDPADEDPDLLNQLQDNRKKFISTVNQIVDEYAQKQQEQRLEAVEVPEEEANKSEGDNSDAEEEENGILEHDNAMEKKDNSSPESESDENTNDSTVDSKVLKHITHTENTEVNMLTAVGLIASESTSVVVGSETMSVEKHSIVCNVSEELTRDTNSVKLDSATDVILENPADSDTTRLFAKTSDDVASTEPDNKDVDFQVS